MIEYLADGRTEMAVGKGHRITEVLALQIEAAITAPIAKVSHFYHKTVRMAVVLAQMGSGGMAILWFLEMAMVEMVLGRENLVPNVN